MRHPFLAYPSGVTGLAFLMLRVTGAALLARASSIHLADSTVLTVISLLLAVALLLGAGARAVAGLSFLLALLTLEARDLVAYLSHLSWALSACAIVLVGPGAFSVDALLFGRRTIHVGERNTKV